MTGSQRVTTGEDGATGGAAQAGPGPVMVTNPGGRAPLLLVCEHASNRFPPEFGDLGLTPEVQQSHVAWDPGAADVARHLAQALDAPLVESTVSRLIYDCNRPPESPSAMPADSEVFHIPGNAALTPAERARRVARVYDPFRSTLQDRLDATPPPQALVTIHSFTPTWRGTPRRTEIGVLHDADSRLADLLLDSAAEFTDLLVERNAPYGPADGVTHTLKEHALPRGLPNVMLEIRNDLIATPRTQKAMAAMLTAWLVPALERLGIAARRDVAAPAPAASTAAPATPNEEPECQG